MYNDDFNNRFQKDEAFRQKALHIVDKNSNYYFSKWERSSSPLKFAGFNWAAFFLSPFWLAYRQMYGMVMLYFILYLIGIVLTSLILPMMNIEQIPFVRLLFPIIISAFFGFKGNAFYAKRIRRMITDEETIDKPTAPLFKGKGTSWIGAVLAPVLIGFLLYLPAEWIESYETSLPEGVYVYDAVTGPPKSLTDITTTRKGHVQFQKYESTIQLLFYSDEPIGDRTFEVKLEFREKEQDPWETLLERPYGYFSSNSVNVTLLDAELPSTAIGEYRATVYIDGVEEDSTTFEVIMERAE
ncbi:DUF2628 domain-containing protein [Bacillus shivajii]|uniref:DUF2628 domain-containing protein n=1 Tax=Bacillus shivajii TaxID=1983719 RepID=UPI001CFA5BDB|nr:DUF2628 domain-containing protein [Bacillus shivajii]UCZ53652.1 DUF2628 domain-containing protein [Bacillus shivajii]